MPSNKEEIEVVINGTKASSSLKEMRAAISAMNKELQQLPKNSQQFADKKAELQKVRGEYKAIKKELNGIPPALDQGTKGIGLMTRGTGLLKKAFQTAVLALLPLFAFQKLIELGQHFFGVSDQVNKLKGSVKSLTKTSGQELDNLTAQVQAIGNTFDKDYNEVLKSGNVLARQMGISHQEAFKLIEQGLLAGVDINDDFLEQIAEYAPQFKAAGIEAEDFVVQLIRAEKEGIFSDKGADAIKEFGLRIREQAKGTKDAMEGAFGKEFTEDLFNGINDGSITTVDALKRVSKQMNESEATASQLQTVVADVFGGAGEDAGLEYLKSLQDIGGELEDMIDVTNAVTRRKMDQLAVEKELAAAQIELGAELGPLSTGFSTFGDIIQTYVIRGVVAMLQYFQNLKFQVAGIGDVIKQLASNFASLFSALISGDFSQIKEAFGNLGSGVADSYQKGYMESEAIYQQQRLEAKKQAAQQEAAAQTEGLAQQAMERQKAQQAEQRKLKEHAEKLAEARKKAKEAELKAEQAIQDLRIAAIDDDYDRQLAQLNVQHQRRLASVVGNAKQIDEQKRLLEEQFRTERAEIEAARKEAEAEERAAEFEAELERLTEEEELKKAQLEEQYLSTMMAEGEHKAALLDLERATLEAKLALLEEAGQGETAQAQKVRNQLLGIEQEKNAMLLEEAQAREAQRKQIQGAALDVARQFVDLHVGVIQQRTDEEVSALDRRIELLSVDEEARQANADEIARLERQKEQIQRESAQKLLRVQVAQIVADGIKEVASIWAGAATLGPVAGPIVGALQTGLAIGRSVLAVRKARQQANAYADGGFTSAMSINGQGHLIDQTGHKVAGVVHEKEWVGPRWMVEDPQYANVIGWLESERTRRFAEGGMTSPNSQPPIPNTPSTPTTSPDFNQLAGQLGQLRSDFNTYAAKVDAWARQLRVVNDPRDIRDGLNVLNQVDADSDIS